MGETALSRPRYGHHGKVLFVDLGTKSHRVETVDESVYRSYLVCDPAESGELLSGRFRSYAHETVGTAAVHELGDRRVLRLTVLHGYDAGGERAT